MGYYRILRVAPDATEEQIQLAYEHLEEMAPERRGASWTEIMRAYMVLMDKAARRAYDALDTAPRKRPRKQLLNDARLLAVCVVLIVAIVGFVWVPLYGDRFRTFSPGDRLVTVSGRPFGTVVKSEERHIFPGASPAPAYLIETEPSRELRWFPAADIKGTCRRLR